MVAAAAMAAAASTAGAAAVPFQPIAIQRINLPSSITSAGWPVFAHDGQHLLFFSTGSNTVGGSTGSGASAELWITGLDGRDTHCLTCGVANDPGAQGEGEVTPFPDGKRVFFGSFFQPGASTYGVLECSPSVVDCKNASVLPVDFSNAEPTTVPPGGAVSSPQINSGGAYAAKLSQDGVHVGFSDIRSDSVEVMVIGTLQRSATSYSVTDPRVINPAAPTSISDTNLDAWSDGGALYEFKTFTDGGADATYVESGGPSLLNPDVWSINLATGVRTRLTGNPDYDEDNAVSPDGRLLALWSNRTMHMTDWYGGLLPVRDFIDTPAALMGLGLNSSNKRCHGPIWVLPSSGDQGGAVAGQPIVDYKVPHVFVTNNLTGWPQWSPDGTMLALNTTNNEPGPGYPAHAPFLLVAHFTALGPTAPLPAVNSEPGSWAISPAEYHPAIGYDGTRTFHGPGGGTVTVNYGGAPGIVSGQWSETYTNYSDNGTDFVNGTVAIRGTALGGTYSSHLTMTGANTGSDDVDFSSTGSVHGQSTYDGNTVSGPSAEQAAKGACPNVQPKEPALDVTPTAVGNGAYRIKVTSSIAAVGPNEGAVDVEPVYHATLKLGSAVTYTDRNGVATVTVGNAHELTVSAGDTLKPSTLRLGSTPCPTRSLTFAVTAPRHVRIDTARVYLDGRLIRTLHARHGRAVDRFTVTSLPTTGTHKLVITTLSHGRLVRRSTRTIGGCVGKTRPRTRGRRHRR
jgi:hypothetical protein